MVNSIHLGEITFRPKDCEDESLLATRVAHAIGVFDEFCPPFEKDSGYKWQLNSSNDWWMSPSDTSTGIYVVAYRYWSSNQEMLRETQNKLRKMFE